MRKRKPLLLKAVYPGTFDPITNGHIDIIDRGSSIFDEIIVAILRNPEKQPLFSIEERIQMIEKAIAGFPNVRIETFDGLLVDYAEKIGAKVIVRGLRAISDFEYELQMAMMNRRIKSNLETVFMMPCESYSYLSSKLVREVAELGGKLTGLVPAEVEKRLQERFRSKKRC
ncbi:MAG: pantetheine-phosphate adenylyltransferase [Acidobacteriota bacterium]